MKQIWGVDKKGYLSIYLLFILKIVLSYCFMVYAYANAYLYVNKTNSLYHELHLFSIYRVKHKIKEIQICNNLEELCEEEDVFSNYKEVVYYQNTPISISYFLEYALVEWDTIKINMDYDLERKMILGIKFV